jgi:hypothetical protein
MTGHNFFAKFYALKFAKNALIFIFTYKIENYVNWWCFEIWVDVPWRINFGCMACRSGLEMLCMCMEAMEAMEAMKAMDGPVHGSSSPVKVSHPRFWVFMTFESLLAMHVSRWFVTIGDVAWQKFSPDALERTSRSSQILGEWTPRREHKTRLPPEDNVSLCNGRKPSLIGC